MDEIFVGDILCFAFGFVPYGWLECNGQRVNIVNNPMLYSLIGSTFGGDNQTYFLLPNLSGASRQNSYMKFYIAAYGTYPPFD